ncbi:MAG: ribulokinase [Phycisphaeraceae bacterium]|nr:ribulokinase [Phycisphaeraceae bacterium]
MPRRSTSLALGLDFGTESVRALLVGLDGEEAASAVTPYRHGQITRRLPGAAHDLPPDFALQDPRDWIDSSGRAVRAALRQARVDAGAVVSIGVDFTSCTMLPSLRDGTPLCQTGRLSSEKYAWPKLWKHHAAKSQTDRLNQIARERNEPWLSRYGGIVGLEWFFPKIFETLEQAPRVYDAAEVWLEGGDWYVWQLVGPEKVGAELPRSTCQAGYKAMWNAHTGYPSSEFFAALNPKMARVVTDKMPGRLMAPGELAGGLCPRMAGVLGLREGTPVSAAVIDAHAGVPGAGVAEPDTLVMVMGTSSCHMLNSRLERLIPGVAGVVEGGILPGFYGYETGQAAVGDAFDWFRRLTGQKDFAQLDKRAGAVQPGSDGVLCMDWLNGCRTPLMDGSLSGAFTGVTLNHGAEHLYRALLEASAFGVRWITDTLREGGIPVRRFVATGGLPHHNRLLVQIYADVLGQNIIIHPSKQGPALGAAILGTLAAGKRVTGFTSAAAAMHAMARADEKIRGREPIVVRPHRAATKLYDRVYARYRKLADECSARSRS